MDERTLATVRSVFLVLLMVGSVLGGTVTVSEPVAADPPSGMVNVPASNIKSTIPDHAKDNILIDVGKLRGDVLASKHADTLEVEVSTKARAKGRNVQCNNPGKGSGKPPTCEDPELVLVLSDDTNHGGRRVAIKSTELKDALGYVPEMAYGVHESGDRWTSPIKIKEGYAYIEVPKFSSNTVSFETTTTLEGKPATSSTQFVTDLSDVDSASDPNVTFSRVVNTLWDNTSWSALTNGANKSVSVAGNLAPTGPSSGGEPTVTFMGVETRTSATYSATGQSDLSSKSISVGGNIAPYNVYVNFTGNEQTTSASYSATGETNGATETISVGGNVPAESESITFTGVETNNKTYFKASGETNGATESISVGGNVAPESESVTFTGVETTVSASYSANNEADGATESISVGGNVPAESESITFTGVETSTSDTYSATGESNGATESITVGGNLDPTSVDVTFTGNEQVTSRTPSWTGLSSGSSKSITVNGNVEPEGPSSNNEPEVTFTGNEQTTSASKSATSVTDGYDMSVSVGGNLDPSNQQVTFTGVTTQKQMKNQEVNDNDAIDSSRPIAGDAGDDPVKSEMLIRPDKSGYINEIIMPIVDNTDSTFNIDVYIDAGKGDKTIDGTKVKDNYQLPSGSGVYTITLDSAYKVTAGNFYEVQFKTLSGDSDGNYDNYKIRVSDKSGNWINKTLSSGFSEYPDIAALNTTIDQRTTDPSIDVDNDGTTDASYNGEIKDGNTQTVSLSAMTTSTSTVEVHTAKNKVSVDLSWTERTGSENPSIDIDDDGTTDVTYNGILSSGQTATKELAGITTSTSTIGVDLTAGTVDVSLDYDDITATEDPGIDVDGDGTDDASYSGIIRSGNTQTASVSNLHNGGQTVTTSLTAGTVDWDISASERNATEDPAVDVDGDNTNDASYSGILTSGQTATVSFDGLSSGSNTVTTSTINSSKVDWTIDASEVTATEDPAIDVGDDGGTEASYSGILRSGDTATVSFNGLSSGSNTIGTDTVSSSTVDWNISTTEVTATEDPSIDVGDDGSTEASYNGIIRSGNTQTVTFDGLTSGSNTIGTDTVSSSTVDWTINADEVTATEDPGIDVDGDSVEDANHSGILRTGEYANVSVSNLDHGSQTVYTYLTAGSVDWTIEADEATATEDPGIDVDGDGTDDASATGIFKSGESTTKEIAGLSTSTSYVDFSLTNGEMDVAIDFKERTEPVDPAIEVNNGSGSGGWINKSGVVSGTTTKTGNQSWLQSGTNHVNVSVGSGSLTADAPEPQVDVTVNFSSTDRKSVTYTAETWTERYDLQHTYAEKRTEASAVVTFDSSRVVGVRDPRYRINQSGGWSTISPSAYTLSGTTWTVDIQEVYGGSIPAQTTVEIKVNGSKVKTSNMEIEVVEATSPGNKLNSKIRIISNSDSGYIGVGPTRVGDRIHYTKSESWNSVNSYVIVEANGDQELHVPNARNDDTFRVTNVSTKATLDTGDARIEVVDASQPKFNITAGPGGDGDEVKLTYYDTVSGNKYTLQDVAEGVAIDFETAESPVTLTTSDDEGLVEIISGEVEEAIESSTGSGTNKKGGGTGGRQPTDGLIPAFGNPLVLVGVLGALGFLFVLNGGLFGSGSGRKSVSKAAGSVVGKVPLVGGILASGVRAFLNPLMDGIRAVVTNPRALGAIAIVAVGAGVRRGIIQIGPTVSVGILAAVPVGLYLVLRELNQFRLWIWGAGTAIVILFGSEIFYPGSILPQLGEGIGQIVPFLGLGGLYLAYQFIQARKAPDEVNKLIFRGDDDEDEEK